MTTLSPIGPGFLMFFQNPVPAAVSGPKGLHGGRRARRQPWTEYDGDWYPKPIVHQDQQLRVNKIMREDQEILDIIITFVTKGSQ